MMGNGKLITYLRIFTITACIFAARGANAQLKCSVKHYSTEDGLSQYGVLCIAKDKQGFMWFGTSDGMNRFDGHNFIAYKARPGDSSSLSNNKIRNIIEDAWGYLWVKSYDNKVYRFDKRTEKFLAVPNGVLHDKVKTDIIEKLIPTKSGDMLLLTAKQGMLCAVAETATAVPRVYSYSKNGKGDFKLCSDKINFAFEDSRGLLWIGTANGLCCLSKSPAGYYKIKSFAGGQTVYGSNYAFTCVTEGHGTMYFGTDDGTLVTFNVKPATFTATAISPGARVNALLVSKRGNLYASSNKGLAIINPANTAAISYATMPGSAIMRSLFEDRNGRLWIEPENSGIIRYNPATGQFKLYTQKIDTYTSGHHTNYSVFETANGIVWAVLRGGGFGYYDAVKDDIAYFYDEPGSPDQQFSNIISAYYADDTDVLWLSGYDGGINKVIFEPENFKQHIVSDNLLNKSANDVRSMFEDRQGRLWIGAKDGNLYVYKNGKKLDNLFVNLPPNKAGSIYTITQATDGSIWMGTKGDGLLRAVPLTPDGAKYTVTRYRSDKHDPNTLSNDMVYSVLEDTRGRIWVGTFGGGLNLVVKNGNNITFKNSRNSFKNYPIATCNVIRYLQQDNSGKIWIATNNGLVIFDPDKGGPDTYNFSRYFKIPGDITSLGNNSVQVIHKDHSGQMWVGTFGGGLYKQMPDAGGKLKFKIYTASDGLPSDIILSMINDNKGNLWVATENGLSRYDAKTNAFNNYDSYEGIPDTRFSESACLRLRTGELLFGCTDGYISFYPGKVSNKKFNADMVLTNLNINNQNVAPGTSGSILPYALDKTDHITLNYDQNLVSIDYTVLDYRASNKILYAYMLDGVDKDWNYVKNKRQATYTNLSPGTYTFRVKSISNEMFLNTPQKSVIITILPPPWLTMWAYIVYFILLGIAIWIAQRIIVTMIRLRNKVVVEHKLTELKLDFFTNISHELKTPLTLIVNPLKEIERTERLSPKGRDYIKMVNNNTGRMIRFINQLLDFRKVQSGKMRLRIAPVEIVALMRKMSQYFTELAHEKNIDLRIVSNVEGLYAWIDAEKIDIVVYNLLSNAFKFSPPDSVIKIEVSHAPGDDYFTIAVVDEGCGVPKDKLDDIFELYYESDKSIGSNQKGTGIGLALAKELVLSHNGTISAANNPGGGMSFVLQLQTGKEHFTASDIDVATPTIESADMPVPELINEHDGNTDEPVQPEPAKAKSLVLVVEDNADMRRFLCGQLEAYYQIRSAADGAEGLQMATQLMPDLIISDVMMPNMDGIEMLNRLKNDVTTSHIPVILLTAKSSVENQIQGLKYGADFYITKPFHTDFIMASVESLLKRRKQLFDNLLNTKNLVQLSPGEILITSKDEVLLKETIKIVEHNLADPDFNIDDVASSVGLGRTTFYKKLKSLTGLAPVEFVRDMRLKRAKQILDAGEHTISETAYMVGFNSSGYFSTCFKEQYKTSPTEYLRSRKSGNSKVAG